jgi:hypothetical protein
LLLTALQVLQRLVGRHTPTRSVKILLCDELSDSSEGSRTRPLRISFRAPSQVDQPKLGIWTDGSEEDIVTATVSSDGEQLAISQNVPGWYLSTKLGECVDNVIATEGHPFFG